MAFGNNSKKQLNKVAIDRNKDFNPPIIVPGPDGAYTLTRITDPNFHLKEKLYPVFVDRLPDGRIQISDDYSNAMAVGKPPKVLLAYQERLLEAARLSPEAIPQIVRKTPPRS